MDRIKKWVGLSLVSLVLFSALTVVFTPEKAHAAAPPTQDLILALRNSPQAGFMVNMAYITITIGTQQYIFFDRDIYDSNHSYEVIDSTSECYGNIQLNWEEFGPVGGVNSPQRSGVTGATLDMDWGAGCDNTDPGTIPIGIGTSGNNIWYEYTDDSTIRVVNDSGTYKRAGNGASDSLWVRQDDGSCPNLLIVTGSNLRSYQMEGNKSGGHDGKEEVNPGDYAVLEPRFPSSCEVESTSPWFQGDSPATKDGNGVWIAHDFPIGDARTNGLPVGNGGLPAGNNTGGELSDQSCRSAIDNGFGWLLCPLFDGADKFIGWAENTIQSKLQVNTDFFENDALFSAWTQIARVSSGLLVVVGLVMIISTALGADMVSSYTLKKVLPRIVIGAIGIWLSWALATTYIAIMNDVGRGIASFMFSPFEASTGRAFDQVDLKFIATQAFSDSGPGTDLVAGGFIFAGLVGAVAGSGGVLALLAAAIPVVGAILIGLFLLSLREAMIVFLVIMAPLGVAAWILPNTQRIWKLWSGTLNKLLLMFPLFMGIFAAGKIFALLSAEATLQNGNNGFIEVLIPMIAYVSPFFFIPALFKAAGGLFGNITGMVNNKGKGLFDKTAGALRTRGDANKKIRDAEKLRRAQMNIASGSAGVRDRWRTGAFGVGLTRGTRRAYRRERLNQMTQGTQQQLEELQAPNKLREAQIGRDNYNPTVENMKLNVKDAELRASNVNYDYQHEIDKVRASSDRAQAERQARDDYVIAHGRSLELDKASLDVRKAEIQGNTFDVAAEQAKLDRAEVKLATEAEDARLRANTALYGDAGALRLEYEGITGTDTQSQARRQAVLNRIITMGDDGEMRQLLSAPLNASQRAQLGETMQGGEWFGAFKDKAPDVARADVGTGALATIGKKAAPTTTGWTKHTWREALAGAPVDVQQHYVDIISSDPEVAASLDGDKINEIATALGLTVAQVEAMRAKKPTK